MGLLPRKNTNTARLNNRKPPDENVRGFLITSLNIQTIFLSALEILKRAVFLEFEFIGL